MVARSPCQAPGSELAAPLNSSLRENAMWVSLLLLFLESVSPENFIYNPVDVFPLTKHVIVDCETWRACQCPQCATPTSSILGLTKWPSRINLDHDHLTESWLSFSYNDLVLNIWQSIYLSSYLAPSSFLRSTWFSLHCCYAQGVLARLGGRERTPELRPR